jgi:hypothetical protein
MPEPIDLEKLESDTFRSYQHEDGMWDVFMGLLMLFWALGLLVDSTFVSLMMLVPTGVFIAGKALITVPRLGRVKFGRRRVDRQIVLIVVVVLAVVVSVLMLEIASMGGFDAIEKVGDLIFIAMAFTVFAVISYMVMYWRIAAYGAMLTGSWLVASLVGPDPGAVAFVVSGTVAVAAGLVTLRSFMRRYPVLAMEE